MLRLSRLGSQVFVSLTRFQSDGSIWREARPTSLSFSRLERFSNDYMSQLSGEGDADSKPLLQNEILPNFQSNGAGVLKLILHSVSQGIPFGMKLREDVLALKKEEKSKTKSQNLREMDSVLFDFLQCVFCRNMLKHERITFESSSGIILEKLASAEAVHKIRALSEMKKRLSERGRRCFALFHPSLKNDPLTFVHVSLGNSIASSMREIYNNKEIAEPSCATYYSINSPHASLSGLGLAETLLKLTATKLSQMQPPIMTHSTLSPIPGFMKWLSEIETFPVLDPSNAKSLDISREMLEKVKLALQLWDNKSESELSEANVLSHLLSVLTNSNNWYLNSDFCKVIQVPLMWLMHYYLLQIKTVPFGGSGPMPRDPVTRFHLRNGATIYRINWLANPNSNGLRTSAGMMVNYRYYLNDIEEIKEEFRRSGKIRHSESVSRFLHEGN